MSKKKFCKQYSISAIKVTTVCQIKHFRPLATIKFSQWRHNVGASNFAYAFENDNNQNDFLWQWTAFEFCM